jgi:putative MFS transporter
MSVNSRAADEVVGRLERLPFARFHLHMASVLGVGTFFSWNRIASAIAPIVIGALLGLFFGVQAMFALIIISPLVGLVVVSIGGIETKQRVLAEISQ